MSNFYGFALYVWKVFYSLSFKHGYENGGKYMANCPKCGGNVANPRKTWKMAGRPDRAGKRTELTIGLFDCPKCGAFRKVLEKRKI